MRFLALFGLLALSVACSPADPPRAEGGDAASPRPLLPSPSPTPEALPADPLALAAGYDAPNPRELALRLAEAEETIRSGDPPLEGLGQTGRIQQAAYRQLVREPEWISTALSALPARLRPVAEANITAGSELRTMTEPREELPTHWRIVEPHPAPELLAHYREAEETFGVPWPYLAAIHLVETRMGRIRGTSVAGAMGPMQFMPRTWEAYGSGDVNDNRDSIMAAARYLSASGAPEDMPRALFAYNRSQRYVRAVTLYAEQMAAEERAYFGYYHWEVYYRTTAGDALLEVGWPD